MSRPFPSTPEAAVEVRRFLRESTDDRVTADASADALLLTTELVTNAIRHADASAGDPIEVEVTLEDDSLRVVVRDRGAGFDPATALVRTDEGGWGLDLVEAVARDWGVDAAPGATEVWFELDPAAGI